MSKYKKIYAVAHTHWDREWYFTINDAALLSTINFEKIVNTLESDSNFPSFCLDGQTSIIEDAIELKPSLEPRLKKLIKEKRIFVGPWHTQTDSFLVDGESYIRNLYFGSKLAEELGHSMKVGYLPDTFGHNIQTPQLFKGFGLDDVIFWRGYSNRKIPDAHFKWKALDGSEVLAVNLTFGYSTNVNLDKTKEEFENDFKPVFNKMINATEHESVLFPIGGDQVLIDERIPEFINRYNEFMDEGNSIELTDYENYFKILREEIGDINNLQEVVAEMRDPMTARVHRTISSSRYDIKKMSFDLENKLINILEPLSILVYKLVDKELVNKTAITKMWKLLLDGHAHDSIGACNTDITNENVLNRFKRAENLIDGTINIFKKVIGTNIKNKFGNDLVLYNLEINNSYDWHQVEIFSDSRHVDIYDGDSKLEIEIIETKKIERERMVEFTSEGGYVETARPPYYLHKIKVLAEIPSFGYKSFMIKDSPNDTGIENKKTAEIENNNLRLFIDGDNINLLDKKKNIEYKNIIELENTANDGDSYDFSPMKDDVPLYDLKIKNINVIDNINHKHMLIDATFDVPWEMLDRKSRSDTKITHDIKIKILLFDNKIDVKIEIINLSKDHRFRVKLNHNIESPRFFTDVPFGFLERKYIPVPDDWSNYMVEQPVNYYQLINTAYIKGAGRTIQVNVSGMKEIEITSNDKIFFNLYKSDGWLGKPDLEFRPSRASGGEVISPEAQMLNKEFEFEFQIIFEDDINENEIMINRKRFIPRYDYFQMQTIDTFKDRLERFKIDIKKADLEREYSLMDIDVDMHLSSTYISYKDESLIFRFINLNEDNDLKDLLQKTGGEYVDFAEKEIEVPEFINKYKAITIKKEV